MEEDPYQPPETPVRHVPPKPLSRRRTKAHRGVTILVLGLVAVVGGCLPLGIPAWIMGAADLREISAGRMDPEGRNLAMGGMILGIISVVLMLLGGLLIVGVVFWSRAG